MVLCGGALLVRWTAAAAAQVRGPVTPWPPHTPQAPAMPPASPQPRPRPALAMAPPCRRLLLRSARSARALTGPDRPIFGLVLRDRTGRFFCQARTKPARTERATSRSKRPLVPSTLSIHGVNLETVLIKKLKLDGRTQKQNLLNTKSLCPNYVWFRDRNELLWAKHWTKLQCINVKILAIGKKSC